LNNLTLYSLLLLFHGECWILYNVNAAYFYILFVLRGLYLKKTLALVFWITALALTLILVVLALTPSLVISVLWHIFLLNYINIDIVLISRYFTNIVSISYLKTWYRPVSNTSTSSPLSVLILWHVCPNVTMQRLNDKYFLLKLVNC